MFSLSFSTAIGHSQVIPALCPLCPPIPVPPVSTKTSWPYQSRNSLKHIFLYIFRGFCVYWVPLPPIRCRQHTVLCHPRWLSASGLREFAVCWRGAGLELRTTDLQSGALPLNHLSALKSHLSPSLKNITHIFLLLMHCLAAILHWWGLGHKQFYAIPAALVGNNPILKTHFQYFGI